MLSHEKSILCVHFVCPHTYLFLWIYSIPDIYRLWRKNLPCGEISPHDILSLGEILHMTDWHVEKVLHIRNVKKICYVEKQIVIWRNISTWEIWSKICRVEKIVYNLWCFHAYCAVLLQNRLILRFTLFCRKICFVAIYALLRGEKLSKKLCPWRKKDKYDVWYRYWYLSKVSIYRQSIFHIGKAIVGRIYPIPLYTPNDIHPPIFGKKCTILMYTQTDVHHSTLGPKVPQTPINF